MRALVVGLAVTALAFTAAACGDDDGGSTPTTNGPTTTNGAFADWPEGPANVAGVVTNEHRLAEPSDPYYEGMLLDTITALVRDEGGQLMTIEDLEPGDQVAVWIDGGCAESFPVQCTILAVEVVQSA